MLIIEGPLRFLLAVEFVDGELDKLGIIEVEPCPQYCHPLHRVGREVAADMFEAVAGSRRRLHAGPFRLLVYGGRRGFFRCPPCIFARNAAALLVLLMRLPCAQLHLCSIARLH